MTVLVGIAIWCVASVPVGLIVGRVFRGRGHDPTHCEWCQELEGE